MNKLKPLKSPKNKYSVEWLYGVNFVPFVGEPANATKELYKILHFW
jgi:hypothetical protein